MGTTSLWCSALDRQTSSQGFDWPISASRRYARKVWPAWGCIEVVLMRLQSVILRFTQLPLRHNLGEAWRAVNCKMLLLSGLIDRDRPMWHISHHFLGLSVTHALHSTVWRYWSVLLQFQRVDGHLLGIGWEHRATVLLIGMLSGHTAPAIALSSEESSHLGPVRGRSPGLTRLGAPDVWHWPLPGWGLP